MNLAKKLKDTRSDSNDGKEQARESLEEEKGTKEYKKAYREHLKEIQISVEGAIDKKKNREEVILDMLKGGNASFRNGIAGGDFLTKEVENALLGVEGEETNLELSKNPKISEETILRLVD